MKIIRSAKNRLKSRRIQTVISLGIGGVALFLALRNVDLQKVWDVLKQARMLFVMLAVISVAVNALAKAARWRVLLYEKNTSLSYIRLLMILIVGQMLNNLFPARIGDIGRAYVTGSREEGLPGRTYVLGTVAVEKLVDLIFYLAIFITVVVLIPEKAWMAGSAPGIAAVTLTTFIAFALIALYPEKTLNLIQRILKFFPDRAAEYLLPRLKAGLRSLEVVRSRGDILKIFFWSVLIWTTAVLNNYLILVSLDIFLPLSASMLILVGLQAGISIPSVPGWIGVFEYICVITLAYYGVEQNAAFGYGLLLHFVVLGPAILAGVFSLWKLGGVGAFLQAEDQG